MSSLLRLLSLILIMPILAGCPASYSVIDYADGNASIAIVTDQYGMPDIYGAALSKDHVSICATMRGEKGLLVGYLNAYRYGEKDGVKTLKDSDFREGSCSGRWKKDEIKLSRCDKKVDLYPCVSTFSEAEHVVGIKVKNEQIFYKITPSEPPRPLAYLALPPAIFVDVFVSAPIAFGNFLCCYRP